MSADDLCDLRSITHQFIPSTWARLAWFAYLELPANIGDWTQELVADAEVATVSKPIVGALVLHTYRVHDECLHVGEQPTGPIEACTVLAVEGECDSGEIVPVDAPYSDQPIVGYQRYIRATEMGAELEPEEVAFVGQWLRNYTALRLRHLEKKRQAA